MATTKFLGKSLTGSFGAVDLSSASRKFSLKAKAKNIDVSTRDDLMAGARQNIPDVPEYEFEWEGLDTTGGHAAIATILIGDEDVMTVNTSQKGFAVMAKITEQEYESEGDKPPEWKLKGTLNLPPNWA